MFLHLARDNAALPGITATDRELTSMLLMYNMNFNVQPLACGVDRLYDRQAPEWLGQVSRRPLDEALRR